jgi:hypothetical protein
VIRRGGSTQRRAAALAGTALLLAVTACTAGSPSATSSPAGASRSPTPAGSAAFITATPTVSPSAVPTSSPPASSTASFDLLPARQPADFTLKITCSGSIGASDPVAIVKLHAAVEGSGDVVLRDYADPATPRTACSFSQYGDSYVRQLIDAHHVVIEGNGAFAVVDLPEVRFHWFKPPGGFLAVGPKLDQVLWLTSDPEGTATDTIHLSTIAGDRVIATLPDNNLGRCGSPEDSEWAAYALSGSHLFVLDQPLPQTNSLIVVEGETIVLSVIPPRAGWPMGAHPLMAVWSPTSETLYYRQGDSVWRWTTAGGAQRYLTGVQWLRPTIAPDGAHLAYSVLRSDGLHNVFLVDLSHGGTPVLIGKGARKLPAFLNSTQLWFRSEGKDYGCAGSEEEKPLIYNLTDSSEAPSIIDWVLKVWPATGSNV